MAAPSTIETGSNTALFVKRPHEVEYQHFLTLPSFHGTEARVDNGVILFTRSRSLPNEPSVLQENYVLISPQNRRGDIYSYRSHIKFYENQIIHNGNLESAIRQVNSIIENTGGKRYKQIVTLGERAHKLFDLFSEDFSTLTDVDLTNYQTETIRLLEHVGLNPKRTLDEETRLAEQWLMKGSGGRDSGDRRNPLIARTALSASLRRARDLYLGIKPTLKKYTDIREELLKERIRDRSWFYEARERLRPNALPATAVFNPQKNVRNNGIEISMLQHLKNILRAPQVNPYRETGMEAAQYLDQILVFLDNDRRQEIVDRDLFAEAYQIVDSTFTNTNNAVVYPRPQNANNDR
ncbi:MAG TPA: hypothetical protein VMR81_05580 [Patescibacteria group bacterium]|nr:hypothetical protein [Patescibacteria group bacterium]